MVDVRHFKFNWYIPFLTKVEEGLKVLRSLTALPVCSVLHPQQQLSYFLASISERLPCYSG